MLIHLFLLEKPSIQRFTRVLLLKFLHVKCEVEFALFVWMYSFTHKLKTRNREHKF